MKQILQAREERVQRQKMLLQAYQKPLVCFTMNIAGPVKNSPLITRGFQIGDKLLKTQLSTILHSEAKLAPTGCEGYYVVDTEPRALKRLCVEIEESLPVGRLFDMDVLDETGQKIERTQPRKCLLCDNDARICGRSRAHSLEALQEKTAALLTEAVNKEVATQIATIATQSLLYEVCTTPKPGLVDCQNSGSHRDMDIFTFLSSASALTPYFYHCARIGIETRLLPAQEVFPKLRFCGKNAEAAMYKASHGVNTHKGAIFSLGLLCAAAGRAGEGSTTAAILHECAALAHGITEQDFAGITVQTARTAGERLYARYGITGVRGQAEAGFPAVAEVGLPVLEKGLAQGLSLHQAGSAALLALLVNTTDTNLIARSNYEMQKSIVSQISALLTRDPYPSKAAIEALDRDFIQQNLSPGGSADLLALTYFLYYINKDGG